MDEVDATVCDNVVELISDRDEDSVVVKRDIMLAQESSPDSGRDTPNDIESDGHAGVVVHRGAKSALSDIYSKTAGLKLDSACVSESDAPAIPVETRQAEVAADTSMAASTMCDQSGKNEDIRFLRSFLLMLKLYKLNLLCVFTFIVLLTLFMPSVRYNSVVHWS
jgi:hypothetical protein